MLSAETANGQHPRLAVATMARIITQAERLVNFELEYYETRLETLQNKGSVDVVEAVCSTAVETAIELKAKFIVVASDSGRMGVLVAKYRPLARILVVTESERVANQMCVSRGVEAVVVPSIRNLDVVWESALRLCFAPPDSAFYLAPGEKVVLVDSPPASYNTVNELLRPETGGIGRWNMVRVMEVPSFSI
jgi:pyruvate kinase